MASYREFSDGPSRLRIEVETTADGAGGTTPSLGGLVEALQVLVAQIGQQMGQLAPEQMPTELTIAFGVRALESGDYAIGLADSSANFRVSLTWAQQAEGALPELPGLSGPIA